MDRTVNTLLIEQEIRTFYSEQTRHLAWTTLILPFGLFFLSDFPQQMPFLFWTLTFLQVIVSASLSWLLSNLATWDPKNLPRWDLSFYLLRLSLYGMIATFISASFLTSQPLLSWQTLLCATILVGTIETLVATMHPHFKFAILCLFVVGFLPIAMAIPRTFEESHRMWPPIVGFVYLSSSFLKILALHRRFLETAKLRISHALHRQKLENFLDAMPAKVTWIDSEFKYLSVNQTMVEAYGKQKSDYVGNHIGFQDKEGASPLLNMLRGLDSSPNQTLAMESILRFKGGEERPHAIQIKKFSNLTDFDKGASKNDSDKSTEYIVVAVDITEQKKIETQLEADQLLLAQAARLSSVGEMAATIAHEIKNPLAIIQGHLSILAEESNTGQVNVVKLKGRIKTLTDTTTRITGIINSTLRLTRDSSSADHEWTNLAQVIQDPLALCAERFRIANVKLTVDPCPPGIEVYCQSQQIGQVILNLLNNAFDATQETEHRQIHLKIHEPKASSEGALVIAVEDNGPGVKNPEKLFSSFYTTKKVGHGTGLGLSLCQKIMVQHEGKIRYERLGNLSQFILSFPKEKLRAQADAA